MAAAAITLRPARQRDAAVLALLSRDLIETGLGWRYRASRMRALIADPDTAVVVADDGAGIAGFAAMSFGDEQAHLVLLAVQPQQRRRGTGRRLAEWLLASARVAGIAAVELELRTANDPARRLYRSLGFVEAGRLAGYYQGEESALRMRLALRGG